MTALLSLTTALALGLDSHGDGSSGHGLVWGLLALQLLLLPPPLLSALCSPLYTPPAPPSHESLQDQDIGSHVIMLAISGQSINQSLVLFYLLKLYVTSKRLQNQI